MRCAFAGTEEPATAESSGKRRRKSDRRQDKPISKIDKSSGLKTAQLLDRATELGYLC